MSLTPKIQVRRELLTASGYVQQGPYRGRYFGAGEALWYCPEVADFRSPLFSSTAWCRAPDRDTARTHFVKILEKEATS